MAISDPGRGLVRRLGVTAAALLAFAAASQQRAEALSLASPGTAPSAKFATDGSDDRSHIAAMAAVVFVVAEVVVSAVAEAADSVAVAAVSAVAGFMAVVSGAAVLRSMAAGSEAAALRSIVAAAFAPRRCSVAAACATDIATPITGRTFITGITFTGGSTRRAITDIPYYHGYRHRYCRVIWTYYGPRKICRYRPWHRHHWRVRYYGLRIAIGETG